MAIIMDVQISQFSVLKTGEKIAEWSETVLRISVQY